jgi:hypothetical protein
VPGDGDDDAAWLGLGPADDDDREGLTNLDHGGSTEVAAAQHSRAEDDPAAAALRRCLERAAQHAAFAPMLRDEEQRAAYLAILVSEETDMEALRHYTRQDFEEIGLPGLIDCINTFDSQS